MSMDIPPIQRANINGVPFHICVPEDEYIRAKMSVSPRLTQHSAQALSGKLNTQSISGVYENLRNVWSFSSYSSVFLPLILKPITALPTSSYIILDHIDVEGRILPFAKPISARIIHRDDVLFCQNEELGIVTMSSNLEDCIKEFQDEILFVWNEYGKESDDKLTEGAKELKRRIRQYVGK
jgi:hypothetical protein